MHQYVLNWEQLMKRVMDIENFWAVVVVAMHPGSEAGERWGRDSVVQYNTHCLM